MLKKTISKESFNLCKTQIIYFVCPFAVYYLRYAVRSFFTMYRISLADGKRAGQKVHRKIAAAVQNVKSLYFLSRSFEISEANCKQSFFLFYSSNCQGEETEKPSGRGRTRDGEIEEGGCEETFLCSNLKNM